MSTSSDQSPIAPPRTLGATSGQPLAAPTQTGSLSTNPGNDQAAGSATSGSAAARGPRQVRQAKLRLVQIEPWSVMKASFLLSVAIAIVTVVAVGIIWSVLSAAGLWDSINSIVQDSIGDSKGTPFQIQDYLGTSRVLGFTMIVAVADIILITAITTLGAFLYNLTATLIGGVEVTFAEDR